MIGSFHEHGCVEQELHHRLHAVINTVIEKKVDKIVLAVNVFTNKFLHYRPPNHRNSFDTFFIPLYIMMKYLFLLISSLVFFNNSYAKEFIIQGRVMDTSQNWLPNAEVKLKHAQISVETDPNGKFTLKIELHAFPQPVKDDIYDQLIITKEGHDTMVMDIQSKEFYLSKKLYSYELTPSVFDENGVYSLKKQMSLANSILAKNGMLSTLSKTSPDIPISVFEKLIKKQPSPSEIDSSQKEEALFYLYLPKNGEKVKAAFYISMHGIGNIDSSVLRKFADEEQVALVGFNGNPVQRGVMPVSILDQYIEELAMTSKHQELLKVPFFTFGHSNGTGFSASFSNTRSDRVLAWISYHPGFSHYLQLPNVEKSPALLMLGGKDNWLKKYRQDITAELLIKERKAPLTVMLEASVGHGPVNNETTWLFIVEYCKAVIEERLNDDGSLKLLQRKDGWLGEAYPYKQLDGHKCLDIASYKDFKGDKSTATWLPNEKFAKTWQTYGATKPRKK